VVLELESLSSFQYLCSCPCMYDRSYTYLSFKCCQTNRRGSSEFVLHTGSSLTGNTCVFAFHLCVCLCIDFFQVLVISLLCLLLSSIVFLIKYLGNIPLRRECDQV